MTSHERRQTLIWQRCAAESCLRWYREIKLCDFMCLMLGWIFLELINDVFFLNFYLSPLTLHLDHCTTVIFAPCNVCVLRLFTLCSHCEQLDRWVAVPWSWWRWFLMSACVTYPLWISFIETLIYSLLQQQLVHRQEINLPILWWFDESFEQSI